MADSFQEALGQRLVDLSKHIKRLRSDFYEKDDAKTLEKKVLQNKAVLAETNKKIKELELNIKKTMIFANTTKNYSANIEELHHVHDKQDKLIQEFAEFKKSVDKSINYTYNDVLGVFRKFKDALLTKEKKDIKHLEVIFDKFSVAYSDFKKKTTNQEMQTERRISDLKTKMEKELNANFISFKQEMLVAVKKLTLKENKDQKLLTSDLKKLKIETQSNVSAFKTTTQNYLFNLDREMETYVHKLRKEMKGLDAAGTHNNQVLESRFTDIKRGLIKEMTITQKELSTLHAALIKEKQDSNKDLQAFKIDFKDEFDQLSANLSNLNDVQIKLTREELLNQIDKVSDKFHDSTQTHIASVKDDILHARVESDKHHSKHEKRMKRLEADYTGKVKALETQIAKLKTKPVPKPSKKKSVRRAANKSVKRTKRKK